MDSAVVVEPLDGSPTLACALALEERAARRAGARTARVGLGVSLPPPTAPVVSFGLAGALVDELPPGALVTATRIVSERGETLWEGEPVVVDGARPAVVCSTNRVIDDPAERRRIAERTGAVAVEMESGELAARGLLVGSVRAISDTPASRLGRLAAAVNLDGGTKWRVVVAAVATQPVTTLKAAAHTRRALAVLRSAAATLAEGAR
jgi:nucleoside phosphorylase